MNIGPHWGGDGSIGGMAVMDCAMPSGADLGEKRSKSRAREPESASNLVGPVLGCIEADFYDSALFFAALIFEYQILQELHTFASGILTFEPKF